MFSDRALETTTTTGTGNLTTAGAVTGYQTLNNAVGQNVPTPYACWGVDGSGVPTGEWETGWGYLSAATTFVRNQVVASSNSGSAVSFSAGTKRLAVTPNAADYLDRGIATVLHRTQY